MAQKKQTAYHFEAEGWWKKHESSGETRRSDSGPIFPVPSLVPPPGPLFRKRKSHGAKMTVAGQQMHETEKELMVFQPWKLETQNHLESSSLWQHRGFKVPEELQGQRLR